MRGRLCRKAGATATLSVSNCVVSLSIALVIGHSQSLFLSLYLSSSHSLSQPLLSLSASQILSLISLGQPLSHSLISLC